MCCSISIDLKIRVSLYTSGSGAYISIHLSQGEQNHGFATTRVSVSVHLAFACSKSWNDFACSIHSMRDAIIMYGLNALLFQHIKLHYASDRKLMVCRVWGGHPTSEPSWWRSGCLITELIHKLLMKLLEPRYDCWYFVLLWQDRASDVPCSRDLHSITQLKSIRERVSASSMMLGTEKDHVIFGKVF